MWENSKLKVQKFKNSNKKKKNRKSRFCLQWHGVNIEKIFEFWIFAQKMQHKNYIVAIYTIFGAKNQKIRF